MYDILEVSRIEQGRLDFTSQKVSVNSLVNEVIEEFKPKKAVFQKQIRFKIPDHVFGSDRRKQGHYSRWYSTKKVLELKRQAITHSLPHAIIRDAGMTELPPGTLTVIGIGPAKTQAVDAVTKDLKLL